MQRPFAERSDYFLGGRQGRRHVEGIDPRLELLAPFDSECQRLRRLLALGQCFTHLRREAMRIVGRICISCALQNKLLALAQVGSDAQDALQPGNRGAEVPSLVAQGDGFSLRTFGRFASLLKSVARKLVHPHLLVGGFVRSEPLVESARLAACLRKERPRFVIDHFEPVDERAQSTASFNN